jgi:hypothetical protein
VQPNAPNILAVATTRVGAITNESSREEVLQAIHTVAALSEAVRALKEKHEAAVIAYIEVHGQLDDGKTRWYVAPKKATKMRSGKASEALKALARACDGDWDLFARTLSTNAIKPGAAKDVLGPLWDQFFWVDMKPDLETGEVKPALHSSKEHP